MLWSPLHTDIVIQSSSMRAKNPRKFKRYLTEPEEFPSQNLSKFTNLTLKQLKLQVGSMQTLGETFAPCLPARAQPIDKVPPHFAPLQARIQNKRNALKKLPELINAPHFINGNTHNAPPPLFKANNPLFVVNALFQIMKEDITIPDAQPNRELKQRKEPNTEKKRAGLGNNRNQFQDPCAKSMKVRPPRILDNQLTRLAQQSTFSRRKICSEEKSRPKIAEKEVELLTFYKPKEKPRTEDNQFL